MGHAKEIKNELNEMMVRVIEKVETAGSWVKPFKNSFGSLPTGSNGRAYNGINAFNLMMIAAERGYISRKWQTFKQIKDSGNKVKKGEKATPVFFFKPIKIEEENEATGETEEKTIPLIRKYLVFNLDQTEKGDPAAKEAAAIAALDPDAPQPIEAAEAFYSNLDYLEIIPGSPAYSPRYDRISMPPMSEFISAEEYYSTLGHEYIHSTGHKTRLNREGITSKAAKFGTELYAKEELTAELGSVLLMAHLGLTAEPVQDNSAAYLKGWLRKLKDDPKELWKAAADASRAVERLKEAAAKREADREAAQDAA